MGLSSWGFEPVAPGPPARDRRARALPPPPAPPALDPGPARGPRDRGRRRVVVRHAGRVDLAVGPVKRLNAGHRRRRPAAGPRARRHHDPGGHLQQGRRAARRQARGADPPGPRQPRRPAGPGRRDVQRRRPAHRQAPRLAPARLQQQRRGQAADRDRPGARRPADRPALRRRREPGARRPPARRARPPSPARASSASWSRRRSCSCRCTTSSSSRASATTCRGSSSRPSPGKVGQVRKELADAARRRRRRALVLLRDRAVRPRDQADDRGVGRVQRAQRARRLAVRDLRAARHRLGPQQARHAAAPPGLPAVGDRHDAAGRGDGDRRARRRRRADRRRAGLAPRLQVRRRLPLGRVRDGRRPDRLVAERRRSPSPAGSSPRSSACSPRCAGSSRRRSLPRPCRPAALDREARAAVDPDVGASASRRSSWRSSSRSSRRARVVIGLVLLAAAVACLLPLALGGAIDRLRRLNRRSAHSSAALELALHQLGAQALAAARAGDRDDRRDRRLRRDVAPGRAREPAGRPRPASPTQLNAPADVWVTAAGAGSSIGTTSFAPARPAADRGGARRRARRAAAGGAARRRRRARLADRRSGRRAAAGDEHPGARRQRRARERAGRGGRLGVSSPRASPTGSASAIGDRFTLPSPHPLTLRVAAITTNLGWSVGRDRHRRRRLPPRLARTRDRRRLPGAGRARPLAGRGPAARSPPRSGSAPACASRPPAQRSARQSGSPRRASRGSARSRR